MKTVLIVDENEVMRMMLSRMLEDSTLYEIVGATGAVEDALAVCELVNPDVILLSQHIADMHIIDAIMEFKAAAPDTHIIVCMNAGQQDLIVATQTVGAAGFVTKPVKKVQLMRAIQSALLPMYD